MCAMVVGWGGKGEEEVEEEMVDKKGMRMGKSQAARPARVKPTLDGLEAGTDGDFQSVWMAPAPSHTLHLFTPCLHLEQPLPLQ